MQCWATEQGRAVLAACQQALAELAGEVLTDDLASAIREHSAPGSEGHE